MSLKALKNMFIVTIFLSVTAIHSLPTTPGIQPSTTQSPADDDDASTQDVTEGDAYEYLKRFGYVEKISPDDEGPASMTDLSGPLKRLQHFAGLNETGELDDSTIELMNSPRCGLGDTFEADSEFAKRFSALARWRMRGLTYGIDSYPTKSYNLQNQATVAQEIAASFKDWSDVADITFTRTTSSYPSDVNINFFSRSHRDGEPFDGPGATLAHAYFPQDGRLHVDNDEQWSSSAFGGPNLRQVVTHEVGHIIGLGHSTDRQAVMYPYYTYRSDFKLQADDINGAVYLYGRRLTNEPTSPQSSQPPQPPQSSQPPQPPQTSNTPKVPQTTRFIAPTTTTTRRVNKRRKNRRKGFNRG